MSERLSEMISPEHMADLETKLGAIENDYHPECRRSSYGNGCAGATDESIAFWRAAVDCIPAMLAELRTRRSHDLLTADRDALDHLRFEAKSNLLGGDRYDPSEYERRCRVVRAIAVLTRLLGEP